MLIIALVLAGCKTLKNRPEGQENTTLKAVSDSQYILRLAPYASELDSSAFVFEVCQISSPNDGCTIAFMSSIRQPVVFTVREIDRHRQSVAETMAKFVQDNPELVGAVGSAAGGTVTYKVGTKLKGPDSSIVTKAQVMEMMKEQGFSSFEQAQEVIAARKTLLSEKLGLEIDKFFYHSMEGKEYLLTGQFSPGGGKPAKLEAHLKAQIIEHPHVYKQDFVDFFKSKYAAELAANNKTAEEVLQWALLYMKDDGSNPKYQPKVDFDKLIDEYRIKVLRRGKFSSAPYQGIIEDIMDPSMAEEFQKYSNLRQVAVDLELGYKDALQDVFDGPLTRFEVHKSGIPPFSTNKIKSVAENAVIHLQYFVNHEVPSNVLTNKLLNDTVRLNLALQEHFPHAAAYRAAKKQISDMGMTSTQVVRKLGTGKQRLAKRATVFFAVLAGILAGAAGAKQVFGIGSYLDKEEGIALRHPSLFEVGAGTSAVDTVQGIVVQLGEYLNKTGVDIDYYCMPSGCQLLN